MLHQAERGHDVAVQPRHAAALGHVLALHFDELTVDVLELLLAALLLRRTSVLRLGSSMLISLIVAAVVAPLLKASAVGRVVIQHRAHHIHDLAAPLLQLLHLRLHILDVHDVAENLADRLQEPKALNGPVQPVSLLLRPVLYEPGIQEELRVVECQVANVEDVGEGLYQDHLDRRLLVLPEAAEDADEPWYLVAEAEDFSCE